MDSAWPKVSYETIAWERDTEALEFVPKSRRRAILPTYEAAIPAQISELDLVVPSDLLGRIAELSAELARFDEAQVGRGYDLPALLLRSESSASSQIENLTSSVRNVALAELADDAPQNAVIIAGNVAAMREALALPDDLSVADILEVHRKLINRGGTTFGGELRSEQVWVGGTPYSPHGALFVPPAHQRVLECLEDLLAFARRDDLQPIAKAAIVHAQFETIHPFIDGNGRTGRTLLHKLLRRDGVLARATLPVSAGLLHNIDAYMAAIRSYQEGEPYSVVAQLVDALEIALALGSVVAARMDAVMSDWHEAMHERRGAAIYRLPALLAEQPVVSAAYVAEHLGITDRAARSLVERACEYGILSPMGNRRRGIFYQADDILAVLEDASSTVGVRRMLSS